MGSFPRRVVQAVGLLFLAASAQAAIVVTPGSPRPGEPVRIALIDQYNSAASVTSASVARDGNRFVISQAVEVVCALPSAPVLTSQFDVGPLTAGSYEVVANIVRTGTGQGCIVSDQTQDATFSVAAPAGASPATVPASGTAALFALTILVAMLGILGTRRSSRTRTTAQSATAPTRNGNPPLQSTRR